MKSFRIERISRETAWKEGYLMSSESQVLRILLNPFWKSLIKIYQVVNLGGLCTDSSKVSDRWVFKQIERFLGNYVSTKNAAKLVRHFESNQQDLLNWKLWLSLHHTFNIVRCWISYEALHFFGIANALKLLKFIARCFH